MFIYFLQKKSKFSNNLNLYENPMTGFFSNVIWFKHKEADKSLVLKFWNFCDVKYIPNLPIIAQCRLLYPASCYSGRASTTSFLSVLKTETVGTQWIQADKNKINTQNMKIHFISININREVTFQNSIVMYSFKLSEICLNRCGE